MESKTQEEPDATLGLRLVRSFLALSPEKRQRLLQFVEELSREQDRESAEAPPR